MKSAVKIMGLGLTIFLLVISCERDTTVKVKPHIPSLVVHGYVAVGDSFIIAVGKTTNITVVASAADTYVKNALAVLYENNVIVDTMSYDSLMLRYTSSVEAVSGRTYRVVVQAPGFTTVEATALAAAVPNTSLVSYTKNARADFNGNTLSDIVFRINDNGAEKNYYLTSVNNYYNGTFCVYTYDPVIDRYQGNLNPFESGSCIGNDEVLVKDDLFNGTSRDVTLSGDSWALNVLESPSGFLRPYLRQYSISEDFFKYIRDGLSVDLIEGNPFVEPHITGGNVKNGYGLFTVYAYKVDTLR